MEDEEEYRESETETEAENETDTADEGKSSGDESDSEPRETFRQGYGSGRRRSSTAPSGRFGGGRGGFEHRGGRGGGYGRREGYGGGGRGRGYGRDRGDRDRGPVPVEEGQELTLTIDALGRRGDGIARINNFVIFVPGAQAGDQVKVRITMVRGSFATGEIVS